MSQKQEHGWFLTLPMRLLRSRAGETEGGGEAQHVSEFGLEEGNRQRQPEQSQPGRQLRHQRGPEEKRPQQLPTRPLRRRYDY